MSKTVPAFIVALFIATGGVLITHVSVIAPCVPIPCDFITGGGFIFADTGAGTNVGSHGGRKNREFWGRVNYVDHGGWARTNAGEYVRFRVRMEDNGEPRRPGHPAARRASGDGAPSIESALRISMRSEPMSVAHER